MLAALQDSRTLSIESHFFLLDKIFDISDHSNAKYKLLVFGKLRTQFWASAIAREKIF